MTLGSSRWNPERRLTRKRYVQAAGLEKLVEYSRKKQEEVHLQELKGSLSESIIADPPLPVSESIRIVQDSKKEWQLPDTEIIKVLLLLLLSSHCKIPLDISPRTLTGWPTLHALCESEAFGVAAVLI